jgi:hypothetical protein
VVEGFPSKSKVLSSIPSTAKKKTKEALIYYFANEIRVFEVRVTLSSKTKRREKSHMTVHWAVGFTCHVSCHPGNQCMK